MAVSVAVETETIQYPVESVTLSRDKMGTKYTEVLGKVRNAFLKGTTKPVEFRIKQLKALLRLLDENEDVLADAMYKDIHKPKFESSLMEVEYVRNDIRGVLQNIKSWAKPQPTEKNLVLLFDQSFVHSEPYGVVLIIGAWNYPVQLTLSPLVGAIAAGNCAVLKPSEISPATAAAISELLPKYLDQECYQVVNGGVPETTDLLKEKFDYIFYTGSANIGKIVRDAANKHLTPVTLELGGKSPVYIDDSVDMDITSKRILWGKFINVGQTCVSPDYILCTKEVSAKLVESIRKNLKVFYSETPEKSPHLARIVNNNHFKRLSKIISNNSGQVVLGGESNEEDLFIHPTVLMDVKPSDPVMQEEIFGPILPILHVSGPEEAIDMIKTKDKPLSLYVFSTKQDVIKMFLENTSSGSLCVNDTVVHLSIDALPFGGVGMSGIGRYHGKYSFSTFSHEKAVLIRNFNPIAEKVGSPRYPPFSEKKLKYLHRLLKKRANPIPSGASYILVFVLGFVAAVLVKVIYDSAQ